MYALVMTGTLVAAAALNAAAGSSPTQVVKAADAEVAKVSGVDGGVETLSGRADAYIDFGELARRALGKTWDTLSRKQQVEFSSTMKDVLRASYAQKALGGPGADRGTIVYGKEQIDGGEATVSTTLVVKKDRFPVVYKLFQPPGGGWKIYDVITDEVSLVATYADQFRQVIAKRGVDGLLSTLKAKKAQLEARATP